MKTLRFLPLVAIFAVGMTALSCTEDDEPVTAQDGTEQDGEKPGDGGETPDDGGYAQVMPTLDELGVDYPVVLINQSVDYVMPYVEMNYEGRKLVSSKCYWTGNKHEVQEHPLRFMDYEDEDAYDCLSNIKLNEHNYLISADRETAWYNQIWEEGAWTGMYERMKEKYSFVVTYNEDGRIEEERGTIIGKEENEADNTELNYEVEYVGRYVWDEMGRLLVYELEYAETTDTGVYGNWKSRDEYMYDDTYTNTGIYISDAIPVGFYSRPGVYSGLFGKAPAFLPTSGKFTAYSDGEIDSEITEEYEVTYDASGRVNICLGDGSIYYYGDVIDLEPSPWQDYPSSMTPARSVKARASAMHRMRAAKR